jgi:hypothetical protein
MRTDRRTDMTKLIVTFRNFAKVPKKNERQFYSPTSLLLGQLSPVANAWEAVWTPEPPFWRRQESLTSVGGRNTIPKMPFRSRVSVPATLCFSVVMLV